MKIIVFGASGSTGLEIVKGALQAGHEVTAFVRDASTFEIKDEKIRIIEGNALNPQQVEDAIKGNDAVLSTLGPKGKPTVMVAESTKNIISAMQKHGVKKIIVISVAGIAVAQDKRGKSFIDTLIKFFLKDVFIDRENQIKILEASSAEWVAVRVPRLTNDAPTGNVKAFFGNPSPTMKISRADLADFMLKQLTDTKWLKQAPIVSNG